MKTRVVPPSYKKAKKKPLEGAFSNFCFSISSISDEPVDFLLRRPRSLPLEHQLTVSSHWEPYGSFPRSNRCNIIPAFSTRCGRRDYDFLTNL